MRTRRSDDSGQMVTFSDQEELTLLRNMLTHVLSDSDDKAVISPYIKNPESEPGSPITFGGGNQTLNGIELIIGVEASKFTCVVYQENQALIKQLKLFSCEKNLGVILVDENGTLILDTAKSDGTLVYKPIPITNFMVLDKKLGGLEEPDSNTISWSFFANWSDSIIGLKPVDYNPLTDLSTTALIEVFPHDDETGQTIELAGYIGLKLSVTGGWLQSMSMSIGRPPESSIYPISDEPMHLCAWYEDTRGNVELVGISKNTVVVSSLPADSTIPVIFEFDSSAESHESVSRLQSQRYLHFALSTVSPLSPVFKFNLQAFNIKAAFWQLSPWNITARIYRPASNIVSMNTPEMTVKSVMN